MKLKHFGLLALLGLLSWSCSDDNNIANSNGMGEINATFEANYGVRSSMAAEGEEATTDDVEAISPDIQDFSVHLTKSDGSYDKTWSSIAEFPIDQKFATGTYTMEIYYGDINEEGFEKPYYYGSEDFEVIDEETSTPSIEAKLGNSMVSITYTDAFKNYFSSYSANLRTSSGNIINFTNDETRPAYVKPGKVTFQLSMTKTNGTELSLEPTGIDNAAACTHYKVTFDVNGGEVGDAVLTVTFDDATATEPIEILLSDDLMLAPAPMITSKGFDNNTTIDIIEGDKAEASVAIVAQSGIASVTLNTNSEYLIANGWQSEIDLMTATAEQQALLKQYGLNVKGLWNNPDKMAVVDFSGLIPNLKPLNGNSTHTFTIQVKDIYGRVAETAAILTVNAPAVIFEMSDAQKSEAGSLEATFKVTYNGNVNNASFKALNDYGVYVDAPITAYTDHSDGTYTVTVTIPDNASSTIVKGYYKGEEKSSIDVKIGKTFTLSAEDYDIWATKAIVKVDAKVASFKDVVMSSGTVYLNGTAITNFTKNETKYTFQITDLKPNTAYTIKIVALDDDETEVSSEVTFTTEAAAQVENSAMEDWYKEMVYSKKTAWVGIDCYEYFPKVSSATATYWSTRNPMTTSQRSGASCYYTCYSGTQNTTGVTGNAAKIATIGWGEGNTFTNTMTGVVINNKAAGMLFMGDYSYSGSETITYGRPFTSRPSRLTFQYTFAPIESESFKAYIVVENRTNGTVELGRGELVSGTSVTAFTKASVDINYTCTDLKATHAYIVFVSSTSSSPAVTNVKGDKNAFEGYTDSIYQGSVLTVDDIILEY